MVAKIHFQYRLNEGAVLLAYDGDVAIWTKAKTRQPFRCAATDQEFPAGTVAYRPTGNQMYRGRRIDAETLDEIIELVLAREAKAEAAATNIDEPPNDDWPKRTPDTMADLA